MTATQRALVGATVELHPLRAEHAADLLAAAGDGRPWELTVTLVPGPGTVDDYVATGAAAGTVWPYVIISRATGAICGSTRF